MGHSTDRRLSVTDFRGVVFIIKVLLFNRQPEVLADELGWAGIALIVLAAGPRARAEFGCPRSPVDGNLTEYVDVYGFPYAEYASTTRNHPTNAKLLHLQTRTRSATCRHCTSAFSTIGARIALFRRKAPSLFIR